MPFRIFALAFAALLFSSSGSFGKNISFAQPTYSPVAPAPFTSVAGDFNADGKLDIVSVSKAGPGMYCSLSVLLGNGDGTFPTYHSFSTLLNGLPTDVVSGDFNNDGKLDVAISAYDSAASPPSSAIEIMLGNGDGTFMPGGIFTVPDLVRGIATADFNGDGILDLAFTGSYEGTAFVYLGLGRGVFQFEESVNDGASEPGAVVIADFNHDGRPDIAYLEQKQHTVAILTGNGDGSFVVASYGDVGKRPSSVAVSDLNGDGYPDLLVGSELGSLSVLLDDGPQLLYPAVFYQALPAPISIAASDFNQDGHADAALVGFNSNAVAVYPGNGDGSLAPPVYLTISAHAGAIQPSGVLAGDFNGDGKPDLAVVIFSSASGSQGHGSVAMFLNTTE